MKLIVGESLKEGVKHCATMARSRDKISKTGKKLLTCPTDPFIDLSVFPNLTFPVLKPLFRRLSIIATPFVFLVIFWKSLLKSSLKFEIVF